MLPCGDPECHGVSKELEKENSRLKRLVAEHKLGLALPAAQRGRSSTNRKALKHRQKEIESWSAS